MSKEDFPYLTLSQVEEVDNLLDGLSEVPTINGITVQGAVEFAQRLLAMATVANELEDLAAEAGFPLDDDVRKRYGSVARIYIQGPGAAQVRLDVSRQVDANTLLVGEVHVGEDEDVFDPEFEALEADVVDLFNGDPRPEVTE